MAFFNPKNISLYISAACAMASCVSDTSDTEPSASRHEVIFDISSLSTRSNATTADNIRESSFVVFGDMKSTVESSISELDIFLNGSEVFYDEATGKWTCTNQRFWHPNAEHSFVAVHPYTVVHTVNANYSDNVLSFEYLLPDNFADTPDLMVATHRRIYKFQKDTSASAVKFKFFHILSRINFLVKCECEKIRITKIELEGVNRKGTYTIIPASLTSGSEQTDDYDHSWSDISNIGTLTANLDLEIGKDEESPLFPDNNALFVIPQPDNNGVIMNITYKKYDKGGNELEEKTLTSQTTIGCWQQGKIYTYKFTVTDDRKEINMSVSVKDWETGTENNIDVPRK